VAVLWLLLPQQTQNNQLSTSTTVTTDTMLLDEDPGTVCANLFSLIICTQGTY
jgi:hypothetical protein